MSCDLSDDRILIDLALTGNATIIGHPNHPPKH